MLFPNFFSNLYLALLSSRLATLDAFLTAGVHVIPVLSVDLTLVPDAPQSFMGHPYGFFGLGTTTDLFQWYELRL